MANVLVWNYVTVKGDSVISKSEYRDDRPVTTKPLGRLVEIIDTGATIEDKDAMDQVNTELKRCRADLGDSGLEVVQLTSDMAEHTPVFAIYKPEPAEQELPPRVTPGTVNDEDPLVFVEDDTVFLQTVPAPAGSGSSSPLGTVIFFLNTTYEDNDSAAAQSAQVFLNLKRQEMEDPSLQIIQLNDARGYSNQYVLYRPS